MPEKYSGPSHDAGVDEQIAHYMAEYRRVYADLNPTDDLIKEWKRFDGILAAEVTDEELLRLIAATFPDLPDGAVPEIFTARCGACGGFQVVRARE
jgi:hypothetical protein